MNPIWKREFFARWRSGRSFLLLLSLVVLLSASAYWSYRNAFENPPFDYRVYPPRPIAESLATRGSRTGHTLFTTLAVGNVLVWFLLAPLLTVTGVARERERGLLESIQLSRMRPISQIMARALSALSYLAALQLATVPIYFVAFAFGGVSQEEIAWVWQVVAASAFCGVGLGLTFSAQSNRPSSAMFAVIALLVVWTLVAFIGGNSGIWTWYIGLGGISSTVSEVLLYSHPLTLVWSICEPNSFNLFGVIPIWTAIPVEQALPLAAKGWLAVGVLGLLKATRDVTRALPPSSWAERNVVIQWWKNNREQRLQKQRASWRNKVSVEGALLADLPFDRLIRFKNPLLNREVKGRFRLRRASPWVWMGRVLMFFAGAGVWSMVLFSVFFDPPSRPGSFPLVLWSEWLFGTVLVGTFAASSFAREREAGTWEGLQLSLFSPGHITRSKWASPLIAYGLLSCPLWTLLLLLLPLGNWNGVPFRWVLLGSLVVAASLCWVSALGIWTSLRAKSTTGATCWTVGLLLGFLVGVPLIENSLDVSTRLASRYYGTNGLFINAMTPLDSPEYLALYQKETGQHIGRVYYQAFGPPVGDKGTTNYLQWVQERRHKIWRLSRIIDAWDPTIVLSSIENRGRFAYNDSSTGVFTLEDEAMVGMALFHILLASGGTLGLLWNVRARLKA